MKINGSDKGFVLRFAWLQSNVTGATPKASGMIGYYRNRRTEKSCTQHKNYEIGANSLWVRVEHEVK